MRLLAVHAVLLISVVDIVTSLIGDANNTIDEINNNHVTKLEYRRRGSVRKKHRSTSSSSGERVADSSKHSGESLALSSSSSSSSSGSNERKKRYKPKSSEERRGWRKWHRKCNKCPEMVLKWRDPSIQWICGAYQRARRSFKSECMMFYRNCQDGTMFQKIYSGRCKNDSRNKPQPHGDHFFYEYKVDLLDDSSDTTDSKSSSSRDTSSD